MTFQPTALDQRYAFLDDVPPALLDAVVTAPGATLESRAAGLVAWRAALLDGGLPPTTPWPPAEVAAPFRASLAQLDLPRFTRNQPALVDRLLADLLAGFARLDAALQAQIDAELAALEVARLASDGDDEEPPPWTVEERAKARASLAAGLADAPAAPDESFIAAWADRVRAWSAIADVFGDLGDMLGCGWDLSAGVLDHLGWEALARLQELVARLPELRAVARALGRLHDSDDAPSVAEQITVLVRRVEEELHEVVTPHVPIEIRGITRGADIGRMLPAEAALLGHPQLRLLWHARRAERALLTYRAEGIDVERVPVERTIETTVTRARPPPERGPIIAVIDTSGSMQGAPEHVAKALVLELARVAHSERRRCFVYAFSGPGQVIEHQVNLSRDGLGRLLDFMRFRFGGGTDIDAVTRALARVEQEAWRRADIVVASDGDWTAPAALRAAVARVKATGTRIHGIQIGRQGWSGMAELCDPVHEFRAWVAMAGW
ncbi:MAG: VWA domain-containing protein [Kofleriaceae bacterium]|nr:VWA domain-containing protein [Kofleriaceae bacterium]MBP9167466.1 VWA domain-containing protein [Kofleriaceae bacterium]MBP9861044.1 VWA domain-containing protein [Kofleriaceae bacterium]